MWLLDANLDLALIPFLRANGVDCEAAVMLGWSDLTNGELTSAAVDAGYSCLLTRDRRFSEAAAQALRSHEDLAIVVVTLPQQPSPRYLDSFETAWKNAPIKPVAASVLNWPA